MSPLLNYSTTIEAQKTVLQIQLILAGHGATALLIDLEAGEVKGISFKVSTPHGDLGFKLPADPDAVLKVLTRQGVPKRYQSKEQAVRVAWRIVKDWVEAQMAILETEQVKIEEVFLPYMITEDGRTLYHRLASTHFQLEEGKGDC